MREREGETKIHIYIYIYSRGIGKNTGPHLKIFHTTSKNIFF